MSTNFNVRNDNEEINNQDQFDKDAELRKNLVVKRKETESLIDTYNTRMISSVINIIRDEFKGSAFTCTINVYDKYTTMEIKLNNLYSLSTTINFNILQLRSMRLHSDVITRLKFLIDQGKIFKDDNDNMLNTMYNDNDPDIKPTVTINLETRTKYF
jgi:hypothetical protein